MPKFRPGSIGNSMIQKMKLKKLFTVIVTESNDNRLDERTKAQRYLIKNLAVKPGDKVKVVQQANEEYYLGFQGNTVGYFPVAHTVR